jgi:predicted ribosomally synthesized peptide with SipW-like signal peptide
MNRRTLMSVLTIVIVAVLVSGATLAYFSDTETSSGNTFAAGTLDLKVSDWNEGFGDGVTATWTLADMKPGDKKYGYVKVDNVGSIDANHLEVTCDYTVTEESPVVEPDTDPDTDEHPDAMAKQMVITSARYDDGDYDIDLLTGDNLVTTGNEDRSDWRIDDADGDAKITLYDLKHDPSDNLPPPNNEQYTFRMTVKFDEDAGNDFQGDTLNLTVVFTLNQDSSQ